MTGGDVLFYDWSLLRVEKFQVMPTKQDLCTSWGFLSKFQTSVPIILKWESPPWARAWWFKEWITFSTCQINIKWTMYM